MVLLYPRHTDDDVKSISVGLGHVLLASGRAWYALRNIVFYRYEEDELATAKFMMAVRTSNAAEKVAKLCASKGMDLDDLMYLTSVCERYSYLYEQRNRLVHDEWWVWPGLDLQKSSALAPRTLLLREVDRKTGQERHSQDWQAERLEELAAALDAVADELDVFGYKPSGVKGHPLNGGGDRAGNV